ncbi:MAG: DUF3862 domain-containing protein [Candidatus Ancaeobacter aquaticus]|nr:DUF3862 domain-containing protein [Candidatus Ancaeobacter aquaticus]
MAMKKCKECGKEVSSKAEACPNCGAVLKKKTGCLTYIVAGLLLLFLIGVIFSIMEESTTSSSKPKAGLKLPSLGKQIVTYDEYKQIKNGMSYRQVVKIIGAEGEEISSNKMDGVPGVMKSLVTVMYQWVNNNGSNMNAMFQNDKLIQKAQLGLK